MIKDDNFNEIIYRGDFRFLQVSNTQIYNKSVSKKNEREEIRNF